MKEAFDEAIRHSITKMSHIHFTGMEEYRKRVIQLGESPDKVFCFGGLAVDNIKNTKLLGREEFQKSINFSLNRGNLLVTYHPVTLETQTSDEQFCELLASIDSLENTHIIFTFPNSDTGNSSIIGLINDYVNKNKQTSVAYKSLGQIRFLSALKYVDAIIGNSSSGLAEAPTFKIGTINVGDRQAGRVKSESVIDCSPVRESIKSAIKKLYSKQFQAELKNVKNPYGDGGASIKIKEKLKIFPLRDIIKKKFYNIPICKLK